MVTINLGTADFVVVVVVAIFIYSVCTCTTELLFLVAMKMYTMLSHPKYTLMSS